MLFGMSILSLLGSVGTWLLGRFTSWGLGAIVPIVTGGAQLVGSIVAAIASIISALAQSPEGRVFLCICVAGLGFLYLRFHYIEEGRAEGVASVKPTVQVQRVNVPVQVPGKCPKPIARKTAAMAK